jgi:hypothetical protein
MCATLGNKNCSWNGRRSSNTTLLFPNCQKTVEVNYNWTIGLNAKPECLVWLIYTKWVIGIFDLNIPSNHIKIDVHNLTCVAISGQIG